MADNTELNSGTGGDTIATDDVGGIKFQKVKVDLGGDGASSALIRGQTAKANALPVTLASDEDAIGIAAGTAEIGNVKNAGVFVVQEDGAALTSLQLIDDVVHIDDTATHVTGTTKGVLIMAAATPTDTNVAANDLGSVAMSVDRRLHVDADITASVALDVSAATVTITGAVTNAGTFVVQEDGAALTSLQLIDNAVSGAGFNITQFGGAAVPIGAGLEATAIRVTLPTDGTGVVALSAVDNAVLDTIATNTTGLNGTVSGSELQVDIVAALPAGTNAIGKLSANTGVDIGDVDVTSLPASTNTLEVVGDVAHDAAAAGNPVAIAARATNSIEGLTQVAAADASFITSDLNGVIVTRPHTTLEEILSEHVTNTNGTSTAFTTFAAGGAGVHNYITTISIWNSSATDGYVDFRDGTAGSIIFTAPAPTLGGSVINLPVPLKGAANTAVAFDVSGALSTVHISVVGFQAQG